MKVSPTKTPSEVLHDVADWIDSLDDQREAVVWVANPTAKNGRGGYYVPVTDLIRQRAKESGGDL